MANQPTIVVALDLSDRADGVMEAARAMAERLGARVALVSVNEAVEYQAMVPPELAAWQDPRILVELDNALETRLELAKSRMPKGSVVETRVDHGAPWRVICETAKRHSAAMIVIGAHGYRPVERFLGTTASRVANRAKTSVLVVRGGVAFDRMVVGHDGSEQATYALMAASRLAGTQSARITAVRAVNAAAPFTLTTDAKTASDAEAQLTKAARESLATLHDHVPPTVSYEVEARVGFAWEVVDASAKAQNATLICIGAHGYHGWDRFLGTVAGRIVNVADRSVLVVRGNELCQ